MLVEVVKLDPQECVQQIEQIVVRPIPQITEVVEEFKIVPQKQFSEKVCEQSVDISVPYVDVQDIALLAKEELMEIVQVIPYERGQERIAKLIVDRYLSASGQGGNRERASACGQAERVLSFLLISNECNEHQSQDQRFSAIKLRVVLRRRFEALSARTLASEFASLWDLQLS